MGREAPPENHRGAHRSLEAFKQAVDTGTFSPHGQGISITAKSPSGRRTQHQCTAVTAARMPPVSTISYATSNFARRRLRG
jgi:hypothetical protein